MLWGWGEGGPTPTLAQPNPPSLEVALSNPRSAPAKGIRVTFNDAVEMMLYRWDCSPFLQDYRSEADRAYYGDSFEGRSGLADAFDARKRSGTGHRMVVSAATLDYLLAPLGFCDNALDMLDAGGGNPDERPHNIRSMLRFRDRLKALRAKQSA